MPIYPDGGGTPFIRFYEANSDYTLIKELYAPAGSDFVVYGVECDGMEGGVDIGGNPGLEYVFISYSYTGASPNITYHSTIEIRDVVTDAVIWQNDYTAQNTQPAMVYPSDMNGDHIFELLLFLQDMPYSPVTGFESTAEVAVLDGTDDFAQIYTTGELNGFGYFNELWDWDRDGLPDFRLDLTPNGTAAEWTRFYRAIPDYGSIKEITGTSGRTMMIYGAKQ